jgi:hypothetical protein
LAIVRQFGLDASVRLSDDVANRRKIAALSTVMVNRGTTFDKISGTTPWFMLC